jgi:hypothetical protein
LLESSLQSRFNLGILLSLSQDSLNVVGLLLLAFTGGGGIGFGGLGTLEDGGSVLFREMEERTKLSSSDTAARVRNYLREPRTTA